MCVISVWLASQEKHSYELNLSAGLLNNTAVGLLVLQETSYCDLNSFCITLSLQQGELEKLNQSTDNINRWETELEVRFTCLHCGVTVFTENVCRRNSKV